MERSMFQSRYPGVITVLLLCFAAIFVFSTVNPRGHGSIAAFASEAGLAQEAAGSSSPEEKASPANEKPFKPWMVGLILGIMGVILALIIVNFFYLQRKLMAISREEGLLESYMQLPFGVPTGTIRSVVTFVVVSFCLILIGFNVFYTVVENLKDTFLPEEEAEKSKLSSFIAKAKEKITAAEGALEGGNFDLASTAVNAAKDILSGKNPANRILQNASGIFSSILGSVPGLGFLGSVVRIGASLGGRYYDSWKKKILNAPIQLSDITPEIITATTAYSIYLNVDFLKQKFRQQIIDQDNQFLLSSLQDFLSLDNNSLWEKYREEFKEEGQEAFIAAADEVRQRLLDYDLKDGIEVRNLEQIENLEVFNEYLAKVSDDREGAKALTSLMNFVDNAKAKNLNPVEIWETFKKETE
jgi:flagellar biogenesis protein FliO